MIKPSMVYGHKLTYTGQFNFILVTVLALPLFFDELNSMNPLCSEKEKGHG